MAKHVWQGAFTVCERCGVTFSYFQERVLDKKARKSGYCLRRYCLDCAEILKATRQGRR